MYNNGRTPRSTHSGTPHDTAIHLTTPTLQRTPLSCVPNRIIYLTVAHLPLRQRSRYRINQYASLFKWNKARLCGQMGWWVVFIRGGWEVGWGCWRLWASVVAGAGKMDHDTEIYAEVDGMSFRWSVDEC